MGCTINYFYIVLTSKIIYTRFIKIEKFMKRQSFIAILVNFGESCELSLTFVYARGPQVFM